MAAEDLILRMRVENGRIAAAEVDHVGTSLKHTEEHAKRAHGSMLDFGKGLGGLRRIIGTVTGIAGIGALSLGLGEMVKNAQSFQNATVQLGAAIRANIRKPAKDALDVMSEFADRLSTRGGLAPKQEIESLTLFTRVTKSQTRAQKDLSLATDMVRGGHLSLQRATRAIIMLEQGRATGLSRMGIVVKQVTTAQDALSKVHGKVSIEQRRAAKAADQLATRNAALAMVTKQYAGATTAYNKTAEGAMANFMHAIDVAGEHIGTLFLPPLTKAFTWLAKFVSQLMDHNTGPGKVFHQLIGLIGQALRNTWTAIKDVVAAVQWLVKGWHDNNTVAMVVVTLLSALVGMALATWIAGVVVGIKGWITAQWALNAALDANAIGIVVLAIGALVGALVIAYAKVGWFRDMVNAAWSWLKTAAVNTVNFIGDHWKLLGSILGGPFIALGIFVATHFQQVKSAVIDVLNWLIGQVNHLIDILDSLSIDTPLGKIGINIAHIGYIANPQPAAPATYHQAPGTVTGRGMGHRWMGGPIEHSGVYTVGEHGQEDVYLPQGAAVDNRDHGGLADAVANALSGAAVLMDGQRVGQLVIRQGRLQAARQ